MSLLDRLKTLLDRRKTIDISNEVASEDPQQGIDTNDNADRRLKPRRNANAGTVMIIIDDSPTILTALGRMLRQNHYKVLEASDAETGLKLIRENSPALIFLDIVLPSMSGFEMLRHVRRDLTTKQTPVIMISGNEQATEQFYVQRIGADDFMKKPFSRPEVFARIERLLDFDGVPRRLIGSEE